VVVGVGVGVCVGALVGVTEGVDVGACVGVAEDVGDGVCVGDDVGVGETDPESSAKQSLIIPTETPTPTQSSSILYFNSPKIIGFNNIGVLDILPSIIG
jgi:hypothetical protein